MAAICGIMLTVTPALAVNIQASVTVQGMCELTVDQTGLQFGPLSQGQTSDPLGRNVALDANTPTNITIFGQNWVGLLANSMSVGQTKYGLNVDPDTALMLTPGALLFSSSVDASHMVNFDVTIPDPQPADTYNQTITIDFSCDMD